MYRALSHTAASLFIAPSITIFPPGALCIRQIRASSTVRVTNNFRPAIVGTSKPGKAP